SENRDRYSNMAILKLLDKEQSVVAIGQKVGEVAGVKIQTKQVPFTNIDTVTLYLNPTRQRDYYNYIISLAPKRVIFNPGTENPELYQLLRSNNIKVEIACTLVLLSTNQY
ncbi:MAG: CoA-binding protein, partial [Pedobacter sp.]